MADDSTCSLSYLIVNYNVKEHVQACIASIREATPRELPHEIIVVDNASNDGSREFFASDDRITYVYNMENRGFGAANNQAAAVASGRFLVVINPDVRMTAETDIAGLITQFEADPGLGQLSCRIHYGDGSIQTMGEPFPGLPGEIFRNLLFLGSRPLKSRFLAARTVTSRAVPVDWVSGAFFIVPRDLFDDLNGFDDRIFLNAEDIDLSARIHQLRRSVAVKVDHSIVHLHGAAKRKARLKTGGIAAWRALASTEYVVRKHRMSHFPRLIRILRWMNKMALLVIHSVWTRPQPEAGHD